MHFAADFSDLQPVDTSESAFSTTPQPRLLDRVRERIRYKHYSYRTEKAYLGWIRQFIRYHGRRHPQTMGGPEVEQFLSALANDGDVGASTQNQVLSALLFSTGEVLGIEMPWMGEISRPAAGGPDQR